MSTQMQPKVGKNVYIAPTAFVSGDVVLGDDCTIMHHVCMRGDVGPIRIGSRVNIQDGSIVHMKTGEPIELGDDVAVGHRAVVHCRRVGSNTLLATGSIVLDDAEIGSNCVVAAAALVPPGMIIPDGKVVMGMPAKIVRDVTDDDLALIRHVVENYMLLGRRHGAGEFPAFFPPRG